MEACRSLHFEVTQCCSDCRSCTVVHLRTGRWLVETGIPVLIFLTMVNRSSTTSGRLSAALRVTDWLFSLYITVMLCGFDCTGSILFQLSLQKFISHTYENVGLSLDFRKSLSKNAIYKKSCKKYFQKFMENLCMAKLVDLGQTEEDVGKLCSSEWRCISGMILIELVLKILRLLLSQVMSRLSSFALRALGFIKKNRSDLISTLCYLNFLYCPQCGCLFQYILLLRIGGT